MIKQTLKFAFLALTVSLLTFSCSKDDNTPQGANLIEGKWNVTSLIEDGDELMQDDISLFTMEFTPNSNTEGFFFFEQKEFGTSSSMFFSGEYTLIGGNEITLSSANSEFGVVTVSYSFAGENQLTVQGIIDGEDMYIRAFRMQ